MIHHGILFVNLTCMCISRSLWCLCTCQCLNYCHCPKSSLCKTYCDCAVLCYVSLHWRRKCSFHIWNVNTCFEWMNSSLIPSLLRRLTSTQNVYWNRTIRLYCLYLRIQSLINYDGKSFRLKYILLITS